MNTKMNVKWSKTVQITTVIVAIVVIYAEYLLIDSFLHSTNWLLFIVAFSIFFFMFYFVIGSPTSIEIQDNNLIINRLAGKKKFNLNEICESNIYHLDNSEIRLWGSGGFCGYLGYFMNKKIGKYDSFVGDYSQAFYIKTNDNKYFVLSCEDRDSVLTKIDNIRK